MTTDVLFPIYEVLVQNIFGSVGIAIMAVGLVLFVILALFRVSRTFIILWLIYYFSLMSVVYNGALITVIAGAFAFVWIMYSILKIFTGMVAGQ